MPKEFVQYNLPTIEQNPITEEELRNIIDSQLLNLNARQIRGKSDNKVYQNFGVFSSKVEVLWNDSLFIGSSGDGLTEGITGAASITRNLIQTKFISSNNTVAGASLRSALLGGFTAGEFDYADDFTFVCRMILDQATNQDVFIGTGNFISPQQEDNGTSIVEHIGFFVEDGILWASNANGTTQTRTDISSKITLTVENEFLILYESGVKAEFYINGRLATTHTTNLPGSGKDFRLQFHIKHGGVGAAQVMRLANNYFIDFRI